MHPSLIVACVLAGITLLVSAAMGIAGLVGLLFPPSDAHCPQCHQPSLVAALSRSRLCRHCDRLAAAPHATLLPHWRH